MKTFIKVFIYLLALSFLVSCSTTQVKKSELPLWTKTGKDIRYPNGSYITAAGEGVSQGLSDKSAMLKIGEQIQVGIKGRVTAVQSEIKKGGRIESSYDITLLTETSVDIERLEGLSIADRYFDEKEKLYYSFAALDRKKASMGLEREVKESHESARKYFEIAEGERGKGEIAGAIHNYVKAIDELKRIRPRENILYAIAGKGIKNELSLIDVEKKMADLLSEVKVSVEIRVKNMGMGLDSNSVASMITEGLADSGFNVVSSKDSDIAYIKVKGEVNSSKKGEMDGIIYAYSNANITILDNRNGIAIKTININRAISKNDAGYDTKGSGATPESAGLNSIKKIGSIIKAEVVKAFNENFMGKGGD
jgi:hypothetical protein